MDSCTSILLTFAATLGALLYIRHRFTRRRLNPPPGPRGNFLFGCINNFSSRRYLDFTNLAKEYGDIFGFRIFSKKIVILSSYDSIKEAFVDNADWLSGRYQKEFDEDFSDHGHGLLGSQGDLWKEHRRFSLSVLKDFGVGRSVAERIIQDELEYLRSEIARAGAGENGPAAINPKKLLVKAVSNVICAIVFSERCSEDAEFEEMIEQITEMVSKGPRAIVFYSLWKVFKYLPGDYSRLKSMMTIRNHLHAYVTEKYKRHAETFNPDNIRDFTDAFLAEMQKPGSDARWFNERQLCQSVWDLFLAGTETTSTTLLWAFALLAKHPDVQRQAQAEIDRVIGDSKLPETADRLKLRFVDAVICEVQRFATIAPYALPHTAAQTRQLRGYDIEEGTMLMANLWNVHRNAPCWVDAYSFNPLNFLDADGNVINTTYLIPFGVGKRSCLGESLARQELFVFLTGLLQRYDIKPDPTSKLPGIEDCDCNSVIRAPDPFRVIFSDRTSNT